MPFRRSFLPLIAALAFCTSAPAQIAPPLAEALQQFERVPVLVTFDPPQPAEGKFEDTLSDTVNRRLALQEAIIERALGKPIGDLSAPSGRGAQLRRAYRSIPMVSMYLAGDEIDALLADPAVADVQLDRPEPPLSAGTMPMIGAAGLHSAGLTGAGSTIAILDTGVDHQHPMFDGRIVDSACFSSNVDGTATSLCPGGAMTDTTTADAGDDCPYPGDTEPAVTGCGHGTHVAGIAAGSSFADPGSGNILVGVAPAAGIVAVQVFSRFTNSCSGFDLAAPCTLSYVSDQIAALDWLYTNRDALALTSINMSLGGGRFVDFCNNDPRYTLINNLRAADVATVIASGNGGFVDAVGTPACIEPAITVGAVHDSDIVAGFSNSATMVDMLAPGVWVKSAEPTKDDTLPGRARSLSGTSMATPHVAGAFALLRAANPTAGVSEIESALKTSGVLVTEAVSGLVRPRIQIDTAHSALDSAAPLLVSIVRAAPIVSPTNADSVTWRVTFDEAVVNVSSDDFRASGTGGSIAIDSISGTVTDVTVSGGDLAALNATVTLGFAVTQDIQDNAGNALANTTPSGANETFILDNEAPVLMTFARNNPASEQTNADTLVFDITFSEAVVNVSADDFIIFGTTAAGVLSGSGSLYTLTLSGGDLPSVTNTVGLDLAAGQDITDIAGNALGADEPSTDQTYDVRNVANIGGVIIGLSGNGLMLRNNGADDLPVVTGGDFTFSTPIAIGNDYAVTVENQPAEPSQTCRVGNGAGTVIGADITDVIVTCETDRFSIGGTATGLAGSDLTLLNAGDGPANAGDELTITGDGDFVFDMDLADGTSYNVTVSSQPANPTRFCSVAFGVGTITGGNVSDILVECVEGFTVGGMVIGLRLPGLVLELDGRSLLLIERDGPYVFPTSLPDGAAYSVSLPIVPDDHACTIVEAAGTISGTDIDNLDVGCQTDIEFADDFEPLRSEPVALD